MANRVETHFTADTKDLERRIAQLDQRMNKYAAQASKSNKQAADSFQQAERSASQFQKTLMASSAALAAAFSVREVVAMADTFTTFTAKLVNANVASGQLAATQEKLFNIAKANGSGIVELGDLYGNLSLASADLGASQNDIMRATTAVASALKLSGAGASATASTILQLGQALGGGTVRAEEFNSLLENSPVLLRAMIEHSDKFGSSISELRAKVNDGKVASKDFFEAIVAASAQLEGRAAAAPKTTAMAFQNLQTSLIQYVGQADSTLGVTEKLSFAIEAIANNIDDLANLAMVAAVVGFARVGAAATASAIATARGTAENIRYQFSLATMAAAQQNVSRTSLMAAASVNALNTALKGGLALIGGPMGAALIALSAAVMAVANAHMQSKQAADQANASHENTKNILDQYADKANHAKKAQDALSSSASTTANRISKVGDKAIDAAKNLREYAAATREAALAEIHAQQLENKQANWEDEKWLNWATARGQDGDSIGDVAGRVGRFIGGGAQALWTGGRSDRERQQRIDQRNADNKRLDDLAEGIITSPDSTYASDYAASRSGGSSTDDDKSKKTSKNSGPTTAEIEENSNRLVIESGRRLANAMADLADTAELRHERALEVLQEEYDDAIEAIKKQREAGEITQAAAELAIIDERELFEAKQELEQRRRRREIEEERIAAAREQAEFDDAIARINEATLRYEIEQASTVAERTRLEKQLLKDQQKAELALLDARHEEARARERLAGAINAEAEARRTAERQALVNMQGAQTNADDRRHDQQNPFYKFTSAARDFDTAQLEAMANGLQTFEDGLVNALKGTSDLKTAFADMADSIIADLLRIGVQRMVIAPIADMLFGKAGGGSAGGGAGFAEGAPSILSYLPKMFGGGSGGGGLFGAIGKLFKFQSGTNFAQGGLSLVGENGPELLNLPRGSQVMPHQRLDQLMANNSRKLQAKSSGSNIALNVNVNANNAVLRGQIEQSIIDASVMAVQQARSIAQQDRINEIRRSYRK